MAVFIESLTTEFTVFDDELPLSEAQLQQVVAYVLAAVEGKRRHGESTSSLGELSPGAEEALERNGCVP